MTVTTNYIVRDWRDLAAYFDKRAEQRRDMAKNATLKRDAQRWDAEADAWESAARVVRDTVIDPSHFEKETTQ